MPQSQSTTQWRDLVFYGSPTGTPASPIPVFTVGPDLEFTRGCATQFFKLRDQIVVNDGYTLAMGEDLNIVGAEITPRQPSEVTPSLRIAILNGETVNISGSMQGMDALKVFYKPKGGVAREVAYLTSTPMGINIPRPNPDTPETGELYGIFIKKSVQYGNFSPNYTITLA